MLARMKAKKRSAVMTIRDVTGNSNERDYI
jgi:hypothetical protein